MGEPVRIADVARRLAAASNPPIRLEFTGLRPGEKVREELLSDTEVALPSSHPLITAVEVPPLCPDLVTDIDATQGAAAIAELLRALSDEMAERLADSRPRRARRSSELRKAG